MADDGVSDGLGELDELIGTTLGNCRIDVLLGEGGMARVYRAHQRHLDRDVAIKVLPPQFSVDPAFVERFKLEARAMAKLVHPNIVTVHDTGEDRSRLYIIMEYINNGSLRQRIGIGLSLTETTSIVRQVAGALTYAHEHGVIHRDVKPMNVLLDTSSRAVLSDFGIARVFDMSRRLTQLGAGVGTPEYMSPEQCRGIEVDARSDIYALGVVLYEMLTGRPPFVADNFTALAHSHIYEQPIPPARLNPRVSPAVQAVVLMALEKDPGKRFQRATDMAAALEQAVAAQSPVMRTAASAGPQPGAPGGPPPAGVMVCPRCYAQNAGQQRFCSNCGLPFGPQPAGVAMPQGQGPRAASGWVTCPVCQHPNQPINRFCTQCGAGLVAAMIPCRNCRTPNAPGVRFCTACGYPLARA